MTSQIAYNLNHINSRTQLACARSGRNPESVKVLLATRHYILAGNHQHK